MSSPYLQLQLARAFTTALTDADSDTRARAARRVDAWLRTLDNVASGVVQVGSRQPVAGLPAWVTLEVVRGGFATGDAAAGGPVTGDERALAEELGLPPRRDLLFGWHLTEAGLNRLWARLDGGAYRVDVPEEAALLVVAWLVRAGHRAQAVALVEQLLPFADRLRFTPRPAPVRDEPLDHVHRIDARTAQVALEHRRENAQIEAQREALAVWAPFTDQVVALWSQHLSGEGLVVTDLPPTWREQATHLLNEYDRLAREHTRCRKHLRTRETLAVLIAATREVLADGRLDQRRRSLVVARLRGAADKRGTPGSDVLGALRRQQQTVWRAPAHPRLTRIAARRLEAVAPDQGVLHPAGFAGPVTSEEAQPDVPAGLSMPPVVARTLARARSASVEALIADGVVASGDVLAELVPSLTATVVAADYPDEALGRLMAAHHVAFSRRRSLLLLDLQRQVRSSELPWVQAVSGVRQNAADDALSAARRVGRLALDHFPSRILPNPLTSEVVQLLDTAAVDVPLTEELAADIFTGRFSPKFAAAALLAARVTSGSLYAAYYDLGDIKVASAPSRGPRRRRLGPRPDEHGEWFRTLCSRRAGGEELGAWSVARNGTIIEQGQVLTTHNLAALVEVGVVPTRSWSMLADEAWHATVAWLELAEGQDRPLAAVKNAAYAWRQTIFFLSRDVHLEVEVWLARAASTAPDSSALRQILGGLGDIARGGQFDSDGTSPAGRRFLGWTVGQHWVLAETRAPRHGGSGSQQAVGRGRGRHRQRGPSGSDGRDPPRRVMKSCQPCSVTSTRSPLNVRATWWA